jgi:hypothetical protein
MAAMSSRLSWRWPVAVQISAWAQQARFPSARVPVTPRRRCFAIGLGLPLVVFVLPGAVFWLIDARRDHCPGISG